MDRSAPNAPPRQPPAAPEGVTGVSAVPELKPIATPAQQVADAVRGFASAPEANAPASGDAPRLIQPAAALHVVLEPPGLGSVSVRLHVSDQRLRIDVQAKNPRTRALIEADSSVIAGTLADAGYEVEGITVTTAPPDAASQAQEARTGWSGPGSERGPPDQGRQERPGHGQPSPDQRTPHRRDRTAHDQDGGSSRIGADGAYV